MLIVGLAWVSGKTMGSCKSREVVLGYTLRNELPRSLPATVDWELWEDILPDSPTDQLEVIGLEPTWIQSLSAEAEPLAILATGARGLVLLGFTASQDFRPSEELATPDFDPAEWKFLGYDVADFYLTSALYNAFGDMEDPKNYLEAFADQLNENGLFAMESDAELFACHKDAVRPDYAPWLPVGVWMALDIGAIAKGDAIRKNS